MTYALHVVSATVASVPPVTIEVSDAPNFRRAKRRALYIAKRQQHIPCPMVCDGNVHAVAVRYRQAELAKHRPSMDNLDGRGTPFWKMPTRIADLYDEK